MRKLFTLLEYNTAISREDFEANFHRTAERVTFSFNGWDGNNVHKIIMSSKMLKL
jgi:hypothetical protein